MNGDRIVSVNVSDVYSQRVGKVIQQWPSMCEKELISTQDMMERITGPLNLSAACRKVVKNGGSSGVDGMTTQDLKELFQEHYQQLPESLLLGSYRPNPVKQVDIPKPFGGTRQLRYSYGDRSYGTAGSSLSVDETL